MTAHSRRLFLKASLAAASSLVAAWTPPVAAQGLGQFGSGPPPCDPDKQPTPAAPQGAEFKPKSPERASLREAGLVGTPLALTGTVSGVTCGPIKGAMVDFWQSDAHGVYDTSGFRLRGHQFTDGSGNYRLETIVPGAAGKRAPTLHVRVQPPGKAVFTTQLFFPDQPGNKSDKAFRPELVIKLADGRGGKTGTFNIVLDM